ncbi:MAG: hypothetical protein KatS3mg059_0953 [Thermomicrobiales bacterium]|nr:MAG: hypothetical protein KatS3mg059_0953 [Thermomicrobiales bacterium]
MRRASIIITVCLMFTSGAALAHEGIVAFDPIASAPPAPNGRAIIERLYQEINHTLATGDSAGITGLLAPEFVDEAPSPGLTAGRAGFIASVLLLRQAMPTARLAPTDILASGNDVAAFVQIDGEHPGAMAPLPQLTGTLWPQIDLYRLAEGQIVQRLSSAAGLGVLAPALATTLALSGQGRQVVELDQEIYQHEASPWMVAMGPMILLVDAGSLTVSLDDTAMVSARVLRHGSSQSPSGTTVELAAGDALAIPARSRYQAASTAEQPATVLTLRFVPLIYSSNYYQNASLASLATPEPGTPERVSLAGGMAVRLLLPAVNVQIAYLTLQPGAALPRHQVTGAELLTVTAGSLAVDVTSGAALIQDKPGGAILWEQHQHIVPAGGGLLLDHGATVGYRPADGQPVAAMLIVLQPVTEVPPGAVTLATPERQDCRGRCP